MLSRLFVSKMRPQWFLSQLLEEDIHQSIKHSWGVEKFFIVLIRLIGCLLVNVVNQTQRKVLKNSNIVLLILKNLFFCLGVGHNSDFFVVDLPLMRKTESAQIVCDSQPLLSRLDSVSLVDGVLLLSVPAIHLIRHHSFDLCFGEHSIPSDVLISVILEPISVNALNDLGILILGNDQLWLLRLWPAEVLLLWDLRKIVLSLEVSSLHLFALKIAGESVLELLQELELHLFFNLRDYLSTECEEVLGSSLTRSGLVTRS
jgi:uncharacterized protein YejL (UPF0352 family)